MQGFRLMLTDSYNQIFMKNQRSTIFTFILMLLSGIFLALALIHLFMFFYHRSIRSNLYFSAFMLTLASVLIVFFICYVSTTPSFELKSFHLLIPLFSLACISLSGWGGGGGAGGGGRGI